MILFLSDLRQVGHVPTLPFVIITTNGDEEM
jgi:hypothetical protein